MPRRSMNIPNVSTRDVQGLNPSHYCTSTLDRNVDINAVAAEASPERIPSFITGGNDLGPETLHLDIPKRHGNCSPGARQTAPVNFTISFLHSTRSRAKEPWRGKCLPNLKSCALASVDHNGSASIAPLLPPKPLTIRIVDRTPITDLPASPRNL